MFKIIVITPETTHPNEPEILKKLVSDYNCTIHIRKPAFTLTEYQTYLQINNKLLSDFVLHEYHSLATEFPVKGIHLKEKDRKKPISITEQVKVISTSIHTIEEAANLNHAFEYIFFSPLFESISKKSYGSDTSPEELKNIVSKLKERTAIPIIGLGGITDENIGLVKKSGFDGAAVLGAVWESKEPIEVFESCLKRKA